MTKMLPNDVGGEKSLAASSATALCVCLLSWAASPAAARAADYDYTVAPMMLTQSGSSGTSGFTAQLDAVIAPPPPVTHTAASNPCV